MKERVAFSTATTGTGTITVGAAESGYRAFDSGDDGLSFDVVIVDGVAWEVSHDCEYTHSGTALTRGTLIDSSTGARLSLTGSAKVYHTLTAARMETHDHSGGDGGQIAYGSLAGAPAIGVRNTIRNSNFGVNQRGVSGTVILSAGQYGHDGWKAGAGGCTYTFSASGGVTTLTISAGTLVQVVLAEDLQAGTYYLSWAGTAQARINGGAYGASGISNSEAGGVNSTVEFGTGTVSKVQYEKDFVTPYLPVSQVMDVLACQRVFVRFTGAATDNLVVSGIANNDTKAACTFQFPIEMRSKPTAISQTGVAADYEVNYRAAATLCSSVPTFSAATTRTAKVNFWVPSSTLVAGEAALARLSVSNAYIDFSVEP
jgi:hypothetical protein